MKDYNLKSYTIRIWDKYERKMIFQEIYMKTFNKRTFPYYVSGENDRYISMLPATTYDLGKVTEHFDVDGNRIFEGDFFVSLSNIDKEGNINYSTVWNVEYDVDDKEFVVQGWSKNSDPLKNFDTNEIKIVGNIYENENHPEMWPAMRWETQEQKTRLKEYSDKKDAKMLLYFRMLASKKILKRKHRDELKKWIDLQLPRKYRNKFWAMNFLLSPSLSAIFQSGYLEYQEGFENDGQEHPSMNDWKNIFGGIND